jgi:hypothetical protein
VLGGTNKKGIQTLGVEITGTALTWEMLTRRREYDVKMYICIRKLHFRDMNT